MGLHIKRTPSKRAQIVTGVLVVFALLAQPTVSFVRSINVNALAGPDLSKIHFSGARYVRENNSGDLTAQLITYNTTTAVDFYVDGNMAAPVHGTYQKPSGARYSEWRMYAPLAAGAHTLTAKVEIGGVWYDAPNSGMAYSLDIPLASYAYPNDQSYLFRPGDNPLRLKIDDEFEQFTQATFSLFRYNSATGTFGGSVGNFTISRNQCDTSEAGHYLLCDINKSAGWASLADGSYAVKLKTSTRAKNGVRTNMNQYWSRPFTVDSVRPVMNDFKVENGTPAIGGSLHVAAAATDDNQLESVNFYLSLPQNDGACTGNEPTLAEYRATQPDADGYYRAVFDLSGGGFTSGQYCVMAVARDSAMNNSDIAKLGFVVDHTGPDAQLFLTSSANPTASTPMAFAGNVSDTAGIGTLKFYIDKNETADLTDDAKDGSWSYQLLDGLKEGNYDFSVTATDIYGNQTTVHLATPVSVGPYVVPAANGRGSAQLRSLAVRPLAPSLIAPRVLAATGVTAPFTAAKSQPSGSDSAVLGAETTKNPSSQQNDSPAVAATESGWKFFGIAWYWWMLLAVAAAGMSWWTIMSVRRRKTELA